MKNIVICNNLFPTAEVNRKKYLIDSNIVIGYLDQKLPDYGMEMTGLVVDDISRD